MPISGKKAIKILEKHGFVVVRQKGSHIVLSKQSKSGKITAVVPVHKELAKGTLRSIANQAQINAKELGL
jgi:predicted RNA binding protein YcfA (HicA-like mRNA interferase family)